MNAIGKILQRAVVALVLLVPLAVQCGAAGEDVVVELSAFRVEKSAAGSEKFEPASRAKPGDVIEYRAVYRNRGTVTVRDLLGTLPVPAEMEYLPVTAVPANVQATVDGVTYARVPLKRKYKLPNGTLVTRDVPPGEYRALRWELHELGAGKTVRVTARMRIRDNRTGPVTIKIDSLGKSDTGKKGDAK